MVPVFTGLPWVTLALLLVFGAGCSSKPNRVAVFRASGATVPPGKPLAKIDPTRPDRRLIRSENPRLEAQEDRAFVAAREAHWRGDTDTAAAGFEALLKTSPDPHAQLHLKHLLLQVYEQNGRWAETLPLYDRFGITQTHRARLEFARAMADRPLRSLEVDSNTEPIPFDFALGQLVVAHGTINGHPARFLLDTGCSGTLITRSFASDIGLDPSGPTMTLTDAGGHRRLVRCGQANELHLGGLTARNLPVVISSAGFLSLLEGKLDGIIGWDLMQEVRTTFDFPRRRLQFAASSPDRMGSDTPNLVGRRAPILMARSAQGEALDLFLDTGYASSPPDLTLFGNAGILESKVDGSAFRRRWRPTFSVGMYSFSLRWPRRTRNFEFEAAGYRFRMPGTWGQNRHALMEGMAYADGILGNGAFLGGILVLDGPSRHLKFQQDSAGLHE